MGLYNSKSSKTVQTLIPSEPTEIKVNYDEVSPRFSVHNNEELEQGVKHLEKHGYAIFSDVLSKDQVTQSTDLLWKYLENLGGAFHIRRNDPESWNRFWPGMPRMGLLNQFDIGQSEFMWSIRGNPNVKKAFSKIWNSNELCVSFDGAGCFRNWHINPKWKTKGGWYHCDQNPYSKPTRCSIQGLVSLTDSDESTGGLVLLPDSHQHFLELKSDAEERRFGGNYIHVSVEHSLFKKLTPHLIKCKAGDLIVWDSRCVHCNTPALIDKEISREIGLLRLVAYVCMSPISMFEPNMDDYQTIEEFRHLREKFVRNGITCSHWPLELNTGAGIVLLEENRTPIQLNSYQHSLVIGTNVELNNEKSDFVS